ncbi:hypothetical protein MMC31_003712 [Peltigera leucophlebia]|nr:hypothetical protein [Peltigera leucophlebia]
MQRIRSFWRREPSTSFQINSDLHLEVGQQYSSFQIPASAPYLVLAGDIGRLADYDSYLDFLRTQTEQFELVFLVLGNHEFYSSTFTAGLESAGKLEKEPCLNGRLVLLHQTRYDLPNSGLVVLGCTLWSKVPAEVNEIVKAKVKDFQKIEGWTVGHHNAAHESDLSWLRQQIVSVQTENKESQKGESERSILVITHHAPLVSGTSSPDQAKNPWTPAFATDILSQGNWTNVKAWVFGHTHYTTELKKGGVKVVSNQRGYVLPGAATGQELKKMENRTGFDVRKVICV